MQLFSLFVLVSFTLFLLRFMLALNVYVDVLICSMFDLIPTCFPLFSGKNRGL